MSALVPILHITQAPTEDTALLCTCTTLNNSLISTNPYLTASQSKLTLATDSLREHHRVPELRCSTVAALSASKWPQVGMMWEVSRERSRGRMPQSPQSAPCTATHTQNKTKQQCTDMIAQTKLRWCWWRWWWQSPKLCSDDLHLTCSVRLQLPSKLAELLNHAPPNPSDPSLGACAWATSQILSSHQKTENQNS